jgi:hypothetical protein
MAKSVGRGGDSNKKPQKRNRKKQKTKILYNIVLVLFVEILFYTAMLESIYFSSFSYYSSKVSVLKDHNKII